MQELYEDIRKDAEKQGYSMTDRKFTELVQYAERKEGKGKERIVTPNGETVSAEIVQPGTQDATGVWYISHFATCPVANMFRRK